ncbi:hypothetical protein GCM10027446_25420 [Angustibacter peucedani]
MHRVDVAIRLHRAPGRHQHLAQHLAAEHPPVRLALARADEQVLAAVVGAGGLQVEDVEQAAEQRRAVRGVRGRRVAHRSSVVVGAPSMRSTSLP